MPALPISLLLGTPSIKFVDELTRAVRWPKLKVKSVEISNDSENAAIPLSNVQINAEATYIKLLEADLQTGKIVRPTHIKIALWSPDISTTESIIQAFKDKTSTFEVTSKSIISKSMAIIAMEFTQSPENLSATAITMELEQTTPPGEETYVPAQLSDLPTIGIRIQSPINLLSGVAGGIAGGIASSVNGVLDKVASVTNLYNRVTSAIQF